MDLPKQALAPCLAAASLLALVIVFDELGLLETDPAVAVAAGIVAMALGATIGYFEKGVTGCRETEEGDA